MRVTLTRRNIFVESNIDHSKKTRHVMAVDKLSGFSKQSGKGIVAPFPL